MSKLLLIPNKREELDCDIDGFILPIKDLSVNYNYYIDESELDSILNKLRDKEIFISLNKNMHNEDLPHLKSILLKLENYSIKGILYYDISIVNYKKTLGLKNDLVWSQEHLVNNYSTVNYWFNNGARYAYLSSEITVKEIKEIKDKTEAKLMANIFGYIPIFTSKRRLISNYLETFNKENNSKVFYMSKEGYTYPLRQDINGTTTYSSYVFNGIKEYFNLDLDYYVINSFLIDKVDVVLDIFKNINKTNLEKSYQKLNKIIENMSDGFLHQETIYKVK